MSEHAGVLDLGSIDQWYDLSGDEQSVIVIWFTCSNSLEINMPPFMISAIMSMIIQIYDWSRL